MTADGGAGGRGLAAACALGMAVSWNIANVGAIAERVAAHYGTALAAVGFFTTILFFAELATMIPAGRLIDRVGPREMGFVALAIVVAGNALTLVVDGLTAALALRFVVGVGVGVGFVAGAAYVQAIGGGPLAQGMYGGLALGTGGLAIAVIPVLQDALAWRAPFVTAIFAAVVSAPVLAAGPRTAGAPRVGESGLASLLLDGRLLRFSALQAAAFGLGIVLSNWVVAVLTRRGGLGDETAGAVGALILVIGVVARPAGGLLAHRQPERARALLAGAMAVGALGTLLVGIAQPPALAIAGAVLVGLAAAIPFGPVVAGLARAFPGQAGAAFAAMNTYSLLTIVIGTPLVGLTFSLPGDGLVGFVAAAVLWASTLTVLPTARSLGAPTPAAGR